MALLDFLIKHRNKLEDPKEALTPGLIYQTSIGGYRQNATGLAIAADAALGYSPVWACMRLIADSISSMEPRIFDSTTGVKLLASDHRIADLLQNPNTDMIGPALWDKVVCECLILGGSYVKINRDGANRAVSLVPIPFSSITIQAINGEIVYHYCGLNSESYDIPSADLLCFRFFSADGISPLSLLKYAGNSISYGSSLEDFGANLVKNGFAASGIFYSEGQYSPAKLAATKENIKEFEGAKAAGSTPILHGLKYQPNSQNNNDGQFLDSRKFCVEEVCRFFGVPQHLIFSTDNSHFAVAEESSIEFYRYGLRPKLVKMQAEITAKLLQPGFTVEFDPSEILQADTAGKTAFCQAGLTSAFLTPNEARAIFDLPPIAGGENLKTPLNMGNSGGNPDFTKKEPGENLKENTNATT